MPIEQQYIIPSNVDKELLVQVINWCQENLSDYSWRYSTDTENQKQMTIDGHIQVSVQYPKSLIIKFENKDDLNLFKLLFIDTFYKYLLSESQQY